MQLVQVQRRVPSFIFFMKLGHIYLLHRFLANQKNWKDLPNESRKRKYLE